MKRFPALLTAAVMLFSITACGGSDRTEQTAAINSLSSTSADVQPVTTTASAVADTSPSISTDVQPVATTTTTAESSEESDRSPLDMIDHYIFEFEGEAYLHFDDWQESDDFDLYRKYFFGTWENADFFGGSVPLYVIDDSENTFLMNQIDDDEPDNMSPLPPKYRFTGFYEFSENVLAFMIDMQYDCLLFWLDRNDPDQMYMVALRGGGWIHRYTYEEPFIFTKTDAPPNEPEENFLSIYKLREMSRDYGIDLKLLIDIEYETDIEVDGKEITTRLFHDDWYEFYPVYLVSEAPDRLELKTQVGYVFDKSLRVDARYTIEKIDGEWVRTVEFGDEAFTAIEMIGYQISDYGHVLFDTDLWEYSEDYDLFRKYFFGTWENADGVMRQPLFVVDDSEKSSLWRFRGFYEIGENILVYMMGATVEQKVFWLDKNEPDRMYGECCVGFSPGKFELYEVLWENHKTAVLTKTDAPPNEPENNYLSDVRLRELSRDHGIDLHEMIYIDCEIDREKDGEKTTVYLGSDYYPKYLISEAPEKVELKTKVGESYGDLEIDAWCTFEKIDGEWVRTVEFGDEAFTAIEMIG